MLFIFLILVLSPTVFSVGQSHCTNQFDFGTTPCKEKPSIRWHLDDATETCMAFEYTGCGGNRNNFKTSHECYRACYPMDYHGCPAGSKTVALCKTIFEPGEDQKQCPDGSYCQQAHPISFCCNKAIADKVKADYNPKCAAGKTLYKVDEGGYQIALIGKNCKSKFCPAGATCVEGNYFATCCK